MRSCRLSRILLPYLLGDIKKSNTLGKAGVSSDKARIYLLDPRTRMVPQEGEAAVNLNRRL
jgi:hypothetical protein